jgi:hypothetical protein
MLEATSVDAAEELQDLYGTGPMRIRLIPATQGRCLCDLRQVGLGDAEVPEAVEAAEERQLA